MRKLFRFLKKITFHPDSKIRLRITLIYCGIGVFANFFMLQVFCMPVLYAAAMCIAFFSAVTVLPFIKAGYARGVLYFFLGTGVPICIYCICFLGDPYDFMSNYLFYLVAIIFLGLGLLAFIPFYLLRHIYVYYRAAEILGKRAIKAGIFIPLIALGVYLLTFQYWLRASDKIEAASHSKQEFVSRLPGNYFTERILGLHWKYHTSMELVYDGWRPPMHDPMLVIALWLHPDVLYHEPHRQSLHFYHPFSQPENKSLWPDYNEEAVKYYRRKFPELPLRMWCPCSCNAYGLQYLHRGNGPDSVVDSFYGTPESR